MNITLKNQSLMKADALHSDDSFPKKLYIKSHTFVYFYYCLSAWEIGMLCTEWTRTREDVA